MIYALQLQITGQLSPMTFEQLVNWAYNNPPSQIATLNFLQAANLNALAHQQ
jgi:hypothetical protein